MSKKPHSAPPRGKPRQPQAPAQQPPALSVAAVVAVRAAAPAPAPAPAPLAEPDLVDRIFDYLAEQFPEMAQRDAGQRVERMKQAMREEFGGIEVYIAKTPPADRHRLVSEVLRMFNGRNASEIARRLQISRATVYRLVKQPGGKRLTFP